MSNCEVFQPFNICSDFHYLSDKLRQYNISYTGYNILCSELLAYNFSINLIGLSLKMYTYPAIIYLATLFLLLSCYVIQLVNARSNFTPLLTFSFKKL